MAFNEMVNNENAHFDFKALTRFILIQVAVVVVAHSCSNGLIDEVSDKDIDQKKLSPSKLEAAIREAISEAGLTDAADEIATFFRSTVSTPRGLIRKATITQLFADHPVGHFKESVAAQLREIEKQLLGEPVMHFTVAEEDKPEPVKASAKRSRGKAEKEWTEAERNTKGPYAPPTKAAATTVTAVAGKHKGKRASAEPESEQEGESEEEAVAAAPVEASPVKAAATKSATRAPSPSPAKAVSALRASRRQLDNNTRDKDPLAILLKSPAGKAKPVLEVEEEEEEVEEEEEEEKEVEVSKKGKRGAPAKAAVKEIAAKPNKKTAKATPESPAAAPVPHSPAKKSSVKESDKPNKKLKTAPKVAEDEIEEFSDEEEEAPTVVASVAAGLQSLASKIQQMKFPKQLAAKELTKAVEASHPHSEASGGRKKWTVEEEEALIAGVRKFGFRWVAILEDPTFGPILESRSNVNLKDKARNLQLG